MSNKRPDGPVEERGALSGSGGRYEGRKKKTAQKISEDDNDSMIGQACVRDLKAGRTHIVPDEEMSAILQKIRG